MGNRMSRVLGSMGEAPHGLDEAKKVMEDYVLVGLLDDLRTSLERFEKFFGWCQPCDAKGMREKQAVLSEGVNGNPHQKLDASDPLWDRMAGKLSDDMEL